MEPQELKKYCKGCYQLDVEIVITSHIVADTMYGLCPECAHMTCVDCGKTFPVADMRKGHSLTGVDDSRNYICIPCDERARDEEE